MQVHALQLQEVKGMLDHAGCSAAAPATLLVRPSSPLMLMPHGDLPDLVRGRCFACIYFPHARGRACGLLQTIVAFAIGSQLVYS